MILVGNTILQGNEGAVVHQVVADMSHKLKSSKKVEKDWKVLNVLHRVGNKKRTISQVSVQKLTFMKSDACCAHLFPFKTELGFSQAISVHVFFRL